ncbi:hypothetical protein VZT92_008639 [Zoarces viviparus]|uniref:Uncharacterized protein n=1 Tax=Zoarces viviparus TaxID=48416 RepID=A0AAW1FFX9_ZOAVI
MLPPGLGQMVQSLEQMLTARAHSLSFWPAAIHGATQRDRGFGPVWRSPDNHPSPDSSCTARNRPQSRGCGSATGLPRVA